MKNNTESLQAAFNKAYIGVVEQGCQSLRTGNCVYRGVNGVKCGVGHIIPDTEYSQLFDSVQATSIEALFSNPPTSELITKALTAGGMSNPKSNIDFLCYLQNAHDVAKGSDFVKTFKQEMSNVAKTYGLTIPKV